MTQASGSDSSGDYLTATSSGPCTLATASYSNGFNSASSTSVVSAIGPSSLNRNTSVYAIKLGPGTLTTLAPTSTLSIYSGGMILNGGTIAGGTVAIGGTGGSTTAFFYAGSDNPGTISSTLNGNSGLVKFGSGTLVLSGNNATLTGNVYVDSGTLNIQNGGALGVTGISNFTTVAAGASVAIQGNTAVGGNSITLNGSGVGGNGALVNVQDTQSGYSSFAIACYDPGLATLTVPVMYNPPVVRMMVPDQVIEATGSVTLSGMFSNQSGAGTYTYSIDWGDGTNSGAVTIPTGNISTGVGSALTFGSFGGASDPNVSHTYNTPGVYYATATVTGPGGTSDPQTIQVTVDSSLAFQTTSIPNATVFTNQTYTLPPVYFTGFGTHTATIDWGDGETDDATITEPSFDSTGSVPVAGLIAGSHAYSTPSNSGSPS